MLLNLAMLALPWIQPAPIYPVMPEVNTSDTSEVETENGIIGILDVREVSYQDGRPVRIAVGSRSGSELMKKLREFQCVFIQLQTPWNETPLVMAVTEDPSKPFGLLGTWDHRAIYFDFVD